MPNFWTSNDSKSTLNFGYTYADIAGLETGNAQAVQKLWADRYDWARRLTPLEDSNDWDGAPADLEPMDLSNTQFYKGIAEFKPLNPRPATVNLPEAVSSAAKPADVASAPESSLFTSLAVASVPELPKATAQKATSKLPTAPKFSTAPSVDIHEKKVSREWYIDNVVQKSVY